MPCSMSEISTPLLEADEVVGLYPVHELHSVRGLRDFQIGKSMAVVCVARKL